MELCTATQAISNPPKYHRGLFAKTPTHLRSKPSLPLRPTPLSSTCRGLHSRLVFNNPLPRATTSEETSTGGDRYFGEERDGVITMEDVSSTEKNTFIETVAAEAPKEESPADDQKQSFEFLDNLDIKFDSDDTYTLLLYGACAAVALWLASAVVSSIDTIPVFPKLMEVVGLGYTVWFSYRYLIFKKNREEFAAKIEELKQEILGSKDD